ncbi:hypothetical protein W911_10705 [Hyphomicrobium nitrativorans NL23]|uniref:L,D-TPase catalytic domain-containing protein n=1 Tax=Hyphomicrobium nitrativorans NL23 TaxID=1029756 RepID=V5SFL4_9HYPH|nr:L,D-transpeptidase family protein [Hyphomicrobium nitrativorans]AHB48759.1 hypothetical protein W911_10705 [Hyphomicrobium nitrativorans NL23]
MGRLALTALALMLGLGLADAPTAEPRRSAGSLETGAIEPGAPVSSVIPEVTTVPAGYVTYEVQSERAAEETAGRPEEIEPVREKAALTPDAEPEPSTEANVEIEAGAADADPATVKADHGTERDETAANEETEPAEETTAADAPATPVAETDATEAVIADESGAHVPAEQVTEKTEKPPIDPATPVAEAIRARLAELPEEGEEQEVKEREALLDFYATRGYAPLWVSADGLNADATSVIDAFGTANEWGLNPEDFPRPALSDAQSRDFSPADQAAAEVDLMQIVLKYARHARGGRIMQPSEQLNSNLDRRAQLIEPADVLASVADASDKGAALLDTHPKHPQFHLLREKYVAALGKNKHATPNAAAKRLRANMEMWRWKWPDIGEFHIIANVPSYTIDVVKDGKTIHTERIVVGELGKQTSIFSRRLQDVTFRPMWRVPESIKVRELWPSLLRGGGMMRQYGLEVETKSGRRLDWRTMDWANTDIRDYEVVQPPGAKSAMGYVKFSFPSQHTIFMHDTPDKWMFGQRQRTLSAGCLRLRNPLRMAELVLEHDKGWGAAKVDELAKRGPLNNEVLIDGRIPMHIVYQTAWVDEDGTLKTYSDIYGHEKRVTLALDGKWDEINKGRNHLAPHVPDRRQISRAQSGAQQRATPRSGTANSTFMSQFGIGF